jgi:hypothetical protein
MSKQSEGNVDASPDPIRGYGAEFRRAHLPSYRLVCQETSLSWHGKIL